MRMRRLVLLAVAAGLSALAVFGARTSSVQAFVLPPRPDPGVAGGGYVLANPLAPNIPTNRRSFEFAIRQSQVTGAITGKSLTMRAFSSVSCALDLFRGDNYVARSWTSTPGYPGIPPHPVDGALIAPCSLVGTPLAADFGGLADLFLVDGVGGEHFTGLQFGYHVHVVVGPDATPAGDMFFVGQTSGPLLPATPPVIGPPFLKVGNVGVIDGVKAPICP